MKITLPASHRRAVSRIFTDYGKALFLNRAIVAKLRLDKTVISPRRWYLSDDNDYPELYLSDWSPDDFVPRETVA